MTKIATSGTFEPAISDHKLVYVVIAPKRNKAQPVLKVIRDFKNANIENLKNSMEKVPWWICNVFEDVNDSLYIFEKLYKDVVNEHIKLRTAKVRAKGLPWVTRDIKKAMNKRYKALMKWQQSKEDLLLKQKYKELRNNVTRMMREAETNYWKEQFNAAATSADFWKVVKKLKRKQKERKIGPLKMRKAV